MQKYMHLKYNQYYLLYSVHSNIFSRFELYFKNKKSVMKTIEFGQIVSEDKINVSKHIDLSNLSLYLQKKCDPFDLSSSVSLLLHFLGR